MTKKTREQAVLEAIVGADAVIVLAAHGDKCAEFIEGDPEKLVHMLRFQAPGLVTKIFEQVQLQRGTGGQGDSGDAAAAGAVAEKREAGEAQG